MKYTTILLVLIGFYLPISAQQTINGSMIHDEIQRDYILYIPAIYDGSADVPLVLNFHGYGSNANQQMFYGDFRDIADVEGFLLVHPQGTILNGNQHWNVGFPGSGSTTDDLGFTEALIDELANLYAINLDRVYGTGMSNGGFMSFLLACQLSEKIAAVASVTGSKTPDTYNACNAQHPTPILQIHGTIDSVVPYNGDTWTRSIEDVISYWVNYNNCDTNPIITVFPDIDPSDGSTVEHSVYIGGDNDVTTEHMKVIGGDHTWPGSAFNFPGTNYDINASMEIWQFFSRFDINGTLSVNEFDNRQVIIYPNPTNSKINLSLNFSEELNYELFSSLGKLLIIGTIKTNNQEIDLSNLSPNIYYLKLGNQVFKILKSN
ncbi:MAG: T9SS type A sorting domain-containing protein [Flavobacteriaceae bacterium]|jgi:polyhydroxybutyrate depolymerase|nr:T9SS type A sorting domain-containing protein [Flavobacteriaceae bacterium]MBT7241940.1 T9SS type A sorting domain-containing protein [Flavobacteriaceae bacterium]|tara:strand:+ start:64 stop:1191 length:1128 start_codon:yes stop_codon:yes gene_type:complete